MTDMLDFSHIKHIHMIGICGTAMGNTATGLKQLGFHITGSDSGIYPPMSDVLAEDGIDVLPFSEDSVRKADLVVIGNAIGRGNVEVETVLNEKIPFISLPEALKTFFIRNKQLVLVTGTHGKTTTTALIAHILEENGLNPSYMIGGVPAGRESGFFYSDKSPVFVMEGDEYDTAFFDKTSKFLKFSSDYLVINGIEFDHADIFDSIEDIRKSFRHLLRRTPGLSTVAVCLDDPEAFALKPYCHSFLKTFGLNTQSDCSIVTEKSRMEKSCYTLTLEDMRISVMSSLPGIHNARNSAAAFIIAHSLGIAPVKVKHSLESFKGVKRRFQTIGIWKNRDVQFIEDFAHHPTAVTVTLEGARDMFPNSRIIALFEPATNTIRSGFFKKELKEALLLADKTILLPVPSRKTHGANDSFSQSFFSEPGKIMTISDTDSIESILMELLAPRDVVIMMSNSSFQGIIKTVQNLIERNPK